MTETFLISATVDALDRCRAKVLGLLLSSSMCRAIFCQRTARTAVLFAFAFGFSFFSALWFPLVVLLLGPILYGVPHLFAGLRYVHVHLNDTADETRSTPSSMRAIWSLSALFFAIGTARTLIDLKAIDLGAVIGLRVAAVIPELIAIGGTFALCLYFYPRRLATLPFRAILLLPLTVAIVLQPVATFAALLLIHNLIAFFYWIAAAPSRSDRTVAVFFTALFLGASTLFFTDVLNGLEKLSPLKGQLSFAGLSLIEVGQTVFPESFDFTLWKKGAACYAFGQSLHYLIWLKIIPDLRHRFEVPSSFRLSWSLLKRDFGRVLAHTSVAIVFVFAVLWIFLPVPLARMIYFSISSYHGLFELVGLALTSQARS